ncbi:RNA-binding protein 28-like [Argonauta hians]
MEEHVGECRTLFVRKIPINATNESLTDRFSEIGPVKRAFVIREKGETEKNRGFGYVTYSFRDDAVKAMETVKEFDGRKIFISFADRRNTNETASQAKKPAANRPNSTGNQSGKYIRARTVVVSQIPKNTSLEKVEELAKSLKKVTKLEYEDVETEPKALMHFKSVREAKMAMRKLDNVQFRGATLKAEQQCNVAAYMPRKVLKMRRLIIRNLSFKTTAENLKKTFEKFGEVLEAVIPNSNNRSCGFGFVQFLDIQSANKAIEEMNAKKIDGRVVAIDWAISKTKYDQYKQSQKEKDSKQSSSKVTKSNIDDGSEEEEEDDDNEDDDDDDDGGGGHSHKKKNVKKEIEKEDSDTEEEDSDESGSVDDSGVEDENSVEEESDTEEDDDDEDVDTEDNDDDSEEDEDDSEEDDSDEEDDDDDSDINDSDLDMEDKKSSKSKTQSKEPQKNRESDIDQGRTIFIRNIPFSCTESELTDLFSKYGEINYCTLVKKDNIPRGSGFIQFVDKEMTEKCLEACGGETPKETISTGGRQLYIALAITREQAAGIKKSKMDNPGKDSRNLHLAREGLIRVGMKAAEGLSKLDLNKRMKAEMRRRQKLKDPNTFVSTTRLCVQNIPATVTDKQLKDIFFKAVDDKNCVISESRIMRDMSRTNAGGVARSLGFGFINFKEHQHALNALRNMNNNPDIFGPNKRLIVEFSLENRKALEIKEKRLNKSKQTLSWRQKKDIFSKKGDAQQTNSGGAKKSQFSGKSQQTQKIMPSHFGPKKRHRDKGLHINPTKKTFKETKIREAQGKQNSQKRKTYSDSFDSMVAKYKKKMMSSSS